MRARLCHSWPKQAERRWPSWTLPIRPRSRRCASASGRSWTITSCRRSAPGSATSTPASGRRPMIEPLKARARAEGLWNLFLPALADDEPGTRLANLEYAPLAEIMGRVFWASEVFNCSAPDTGNMELLHMFATPAQREAWLAPLLRGEIRSCFAMTEPDVASSDATNIRTTDPARGRPLRHQRPQVVHHRRRRSALQDLHPDGRDRTRTAPPHERHSMVLVPMATPGVTVVRNLPIMHHTAPEGHCEMRFDECARAGRQPAGRGGQGLRARPGAARARPHPPLHALDRPVRAGARADVRARAPSARLSARSCTSTARSPSGSRSRAWRSTRRASWCCAPPG